MYVGFESDGNASIWPSCWIQDPLFLVDALVRLWRYGYRTLVTQLYFNPERGVDAARVAKLARGTAVDGKQSDYQAAFDVVLAKD
jgi:hypothetical protein